MYGIRCKNCGHQETPHCYENIRKETDEEHPENPVCDEFEMSEEDQIYHNQEAKKEQQEREYLADQKFYVLTPYGVFDLEG